MGKMEKLDGSAGAAVAPGGVPWAFSAAHVERLTGLSPAQLRSWDEAGFFKPEMACEDRRRPYSRVYSFRDVVGLRTIGILMRDYKIPLRELKKTAQR